MIVTAEVRGAEQIIERFGVVSAGVRARMVDAMNTVGADLAAYVQGSKLSGQLLKVRTGNLRRSINNQVEQGSTLISAVVGSNQTAQQYAPGLEYGAAAHVITPRNAMVLAFTIGGRKVFARSVNHPGNRPYRFLRDSLAEKAPEMTEKVRADMLQFIRGEA